MTPEEQVAHDAEVEKQLRDLATQIAQMTKLGFDPMTIRKGIIASVDDTANPPTVSINISGDTDTLVTQVRTLNNYTPLAGQTVLVAKQGTEIFLLGGIASTVARTAPAQAATLDNGWIKADLSAGSHGGNSNDVYYRRVLDHGAWKVQWRGVWNVSGTSMISSGKALDPEYRPSSYRAISCARDIQTSSSIATIRMDFAADGTIAYFQQSPGISATTSIGGSTSSENTASTVSHNHGGLAGGTYTIPTSTITHDDGYHSHSISVNSHSHGGSTVIDAPQWISLNGVEYFL